MAAISWPAARRPAMAPAASGADPDATPADPRVALKRAPKEFLDRTARVDYAAALKTSSGRRVFVDATLEQKPREWKLCFRAGRDACEAARTFATNWMAELK